MHAIHFLSVACFSLHTEETENGAMISNRIHKQSANFLTCLTSVLFRFVSESDSLWKCYLFLLFGFNGITYTHTHTPRTHEYWVGNIRECEKATGKSWMAELCDH